MIVELTCDLKSFKSLRFRSGLNILLAERHESSGPRDTRNGTGKTSFIELVHYLLSERRNPNDDFHKPELVGTEFACKFSNGANEFTISRKSGPSDEARKDGEPVAPTSLRTDLALEWFGLTAEDTSASYSPKFGALLPYFIRKERNGGFVSPTMNASVQSGWDSQVCLSYLLGFDWRLSQELQICKDQKKDADALYKIIKKGVLTERDLDLNKMQSRLDFLDREIELKRTEVATSTVVDGYRQHEATANDLRVRLDIHLIEFIVHLQHVAALAARRAMKRHAASCDHASELSKLPS